MAQYFNENFDQQENDAVIMSFPDAAFERYTVCVETGECLNIPQPRSAFGNDKDYSWHVSDCEEGKEPGRVLRNGQRIVPFKSATIEFWIPVAQMVWFKHFGDWAYAPIAHKDGDYTNCAIGNLELSVSPTSADTPVHFRKTKDPVAASPEHDEAAYEVRRRFYIADDGEVIDKNTQQPVQTCIGEDGREFVEFDDEQAMPLSHVVVALMTNTYPSDVYHANFDLRDSRWQNLVYTD